MKYYSTMKNNEILPFATIWMELEGIMLNEISQIEKDKYWMFSLICGILNTKQTETDTDAENKLVVDRGGRVWLK